MKAGDRIKILHVVFSLDPGGMENGLVNVAKALSPEEFEVHVCCLNSGGSFVERLPQPGNVYILGRKGGFDLKSIFALSQVIRRIKPDVVHSHNLGSLTYSSFATGFGLRTPILHGEHGTLPEDQCSAKRVRQRRLLYRCCRKIHTVSFGQRSQLSELGLPTEEIVAITNGVDTNRFTPGDKMSVRKMLNLFPQDCQVLGIVGRFVALKRHLDLIEAFEEIAPKLEKARLLIVGGGGAETEKIQRRASDSKFSSRIHLVGFQSNPEIFYQAMDLLVVPSVIEGMSNVVLEAMACGVPVLAHEACGNSEMLQNGHDGVLSDLSTVGLLRHGIEVALSDLSMLQETGQRARRKVVEKFSITRMVAAYENLYREVVS